MASKEDKVTEVNYQEPGKEQRLLAIQRAIKERRLLDEALAEAREAKEALRFVRQQLQFPSQGFDKQDLMDRIDLALRPGHLERFDAFQEAARKQINALYRMKDAYEDKVRADLAEAALETFEAAFEKKD